MPEWVLGKTQHGGIALLNITGRGSSINVGESKASVSKYRGLTLVSGIDANKIESPKTRSISAFFPDVSEWAGLTSIHVAPTFDEERRAKEVQISVLSNPSYKEEFHGRSIELSTHWETYGSANRKTVYAPLQVTCSSRRFRPIIDLLKPLFHIQDLINLAYQGLVLADGGRAQLQQGCEDRNPQFWNSTLMHMPGGSKPPPSLTENPLFWLNDLGGSRGIKLWLELCRNHPRAIYPLTEQYRLGQVSPETKLMQVAAAIEYWTAANARSTKWSKAAKPQSLAVARRAGPSFSRWVGGRHKKWADEFWNEYLGVKHLTKRTPDPQLCRILAESGAVLLTCVLLKRITGGSNLIVERILTSHRLHNLGRAAREAI